MALYSVKMRSSKENNHISGAESIIQEQNLEEAVSLLLKRALSHSKGKADFINIKVEEIQDDEIHYIKPLPVTTIEVEDHIQGMKSVEYMLGKLGIDKEKAKYITKMLKTTSNMRGAILLDINTMERLEPDKERGIRATYMDFEGSKLNHLNKDVKYNSHFIEALALASKVIGSPYIIGEVCYSDDPNYTAGYVASKEYGYVRFPYLKEFGNITGGRIFLYDSSKDNVEECINYIENTKVIIKDCIKFKDSISYEGFINERLC